MSRLLLILLLLVPLTGLAQGAIYRTTDADGNVVFTDAPPAGASKTEQVNMRRTNTTPPPPQALAEPQAKHAPEIVAAKPPGVTITAPANETTIPNGPGNFDVTVQVEPELGDTQSLQLFMDGAAHGEPQRASTWKLTHVFRGQHDITVGIINAEGETAAMSEPLRVYVFRPGI